MMKLGNCENCGKKLRLNDIATLYSLSLSGNCIYSYFCKYCIKKNQRKLQYLNDLKLDLMDNVINIKEYKKRIKG